MEKKQENQYGIKIDDIFCMECHWASKFVNFFQVVDLKGKSKVILKEIEFEEIGNHGETSIVMPCKNQFKKKEKSRYVEDNSIGETKIVKFDEDKKIAFVRIITYYSRNSSDNSYYKQDYFETAYLWDGKPKEYYLNYLV